MFRKKLYFSIIIIFLFVFNCICYCFPIENTIKEVIPQGSLNNLSGAIAERFVCNYMKASQYTQIDVGVGRNGIDGLFYKKINGEMKIYIIEVKYNTSGLGQIKGKNGQPVKQMSKEWQLKKIDEKIKSLEKKYHKNPKLYGKKIEQLKEVKSYVKRGKVNSLLLEIKPKKENPNVFRIELYELDKNANKINISKKLKIVEEIDLKKKYIPGTPIYKKQLYLKKAIYEVKIEELEKNLNKITDPPKRKEIKKVLIKLKNKLAYVERKLAIANGNISNSTKTTKKLIIKNFNIKNIYKFFKKPDLIIKNSTKYIKNLLEKEGAEIVPAVITPKGVLITFGKTGGVVFLIESGEALYQYFKGTISRGDFYNKLEDSALKGGMLGGSIAVYTILVSTPAGWVVGAISMGGYLVIDKGVKLWRESKNKKYLTIEDLKAFGLELESNLEIKNNSNLEVKDNTNNFDIIENSTLDFQNKSNNLEIKSEKSILK